MNVTGRIPRKPVIRALILCGVLIAAVTALAVFLSRHPVSLLKETEWSIGIYQGDSWSHLQARGTANPVLGRSDVTDVKADYVADPFMVRNGDTWYMFFEVMNSLSQQGDIGCAISQDGLRWEYRSIVLDEPFHLSYPYVFQWEGQFYMIPESAAAGAIRLYRATNFPDSWTLESELIRGSFADTCIFNAGGTWWILSCSKPATHDELRLYFSDGLSGPWFEHPSSPIIRADAKRGQSAGRVIVADGRLVRFAQDSEKTYGKKVRAFMITDINKASYAEREFEGNPILRNQASGWNGHGMHHLDAHELSSGKWFAAVDGYRKRLILRMDY